MAAGATVVVGRLRCPLASPSGGGRAAVVPDFRGRRASAAVSWAERAGLYWELDRLPRLRGATGRTLLDDYVVADQSPAAGSMLARGVDCSSYGGECYEVTPPRMHVRLVRG